MTTRSAKKRKMYVDRLLAKETDIAIPPMEENVIYISIIQIVKRFVL